MRKSSRFQTLFVPLMLTFMSNMALARPIGDTIVLAQLPPTPGFPEGIVVNGDRFYVSTPAKLGTIGMGPNKVEVFDRLTGNLVDEIVQTGEDDLREHTFSGMGFDSQGRLYVLDSQFGVVRYNTTTHAREIYAPTLPDLRPCLISLAPCSPTLADAFPLPNAMAFDANGNLYITDSLQATIWRVPKGGGAPKIWFQSSLFDGFSLNGMRVNPEGTHLYFVTTASASGLQEKIYTLPLVASPTPSDLNVFYTFDIGAGPDEIAFGSSGRIYVSLAVANQILILGPTGTEVTRFPSATENAARTVPYDMPSGIAFNDANRSLLVNNHSEFLGIPSRFVVFDVFVDDTASPVPRPSIP